MSLDKKVDGIKKLSKKEIEKSRRIVLDLINENEKNKKPEIEKKGLRRIDSVFSINEDKKEDSVGVVKIDKKIEEKRERKLQKEKINKIKENKVLEKEGIVNEPLGPRLMEEMENNKPIKIKETSEVKKCLNSIKKNKQEKLKKNKDKEQLKIENKKERINNERKKIKKEHEEKKKTEKTNNENKKEKLLVAQVKKEAKKKKIEEKEAKKKTRNKRIKNNFIDRKNNFKLRARMIIKKIAYIFLISFLLIAIIYYLFVIIIINFKLDNSITRKISEYIIIPAYITKDGIVEYYKYCDLKDNIVFKYGSLNNSDKAVKIEVINNVITKKLLKEYNLSYTSNYIENELAQKFVEDKTINQVGYNRIKKIKEMIDNGNDFVKIADKYGDEKDKINIKISDVENYSYGKRVINLKVNEISEIISGIDGYYLFRCYSKTDKVIGLSYVKINTISIEEYMSRVIEDYKLISFVD